ncbi:MAG: TPM domain-containing protein [Gammaproteobacteria bacterium]|nr:TPM domain-containing protein [Gammaproteobacteria bacterium]MDH5653912.1 TPM domain-containing protein [Gammaproteobacteria bacterium]
MRFIISPIIALFFLCFSLQSFALDIPPLQGRVNDYAGILSPYTAGQIAALLENHEMQTGNQIAVLTLDSLEGEVLEDFANRVFRRWGLGQKEKNNGVLLMISRSDRKLRIEVGYGLEGVLTDAGSSRIIQTTIVPYFKRGDFNNGILAGAQAIIATLDGNPVNEGGDAEMIKPDMPADTDLALDMPTLSWSERILIGSFVFGILGLFTVMGLLIPGMGWFLYFFLIPFWGTFPMIIIGTGNAVTLLITYLIVFPILKLIIGRTKWHKSSQFSRMRSSSSYSRSGYSSGYSSSSSSSSFSGGGGSSGGGGASGSW